MLVTVVLSTSAENYEQKLDLTSATASRCSHKPSTAQLR